MGLVEIGLLLVGLLLGPFINFAIYSFAYFPRPISPWQTPPAEILTRSSAAKIPIAGWFFRRKEGVHFGQWFWLRPMLIELATPLVLVFTYRNSMAGAFMPVGGLLPIGAGTLLHQFIAFALLFALMTVATFIDFDERTIPDFVTIPGTLLGIVGAVLFPDWRLHELTIPVFPAVAGLAAPIQANSPQTWNVAWDGNLGLFLALFFWSGWCFGMADRRWISRRGMNKAFVYFFAALRRNPTTKLLLGLWIAGLICLSVAYCTVAPPRWEALLSSLFGIGLGGVLVWGFRIAAAVAMRQEALGFGDVTLMAMIGSFFGWQIVWIAFFLAPFFGMLIVLVVWAITRDNSLPFGPYLCAATVYCMLDWNRLWDYLSIYFELFPPELILFLLPALLLVMGTLLWVVRSAKQALTSDRA